MSRKIICIIFASLFTCLVPINSEARKQKKALSDSTAVSVADTSRLEVAADSIAGRLDSLAAASLDSIDLVPLFSDEYLDTVKMKKAKSINDYTMIGVQYGVSLSQMRFNPTKRQGMLISPYNFGITYTRYGKMFGYMPYFGFQTGVLFGQDGYVFKKNKETGDYNESVDGATKAVYSYAEVPLLAHLHIDVWHLKLIVNLGLYAGYRLEVEREGERLDPQYANTFYDYDRRFDYGAKAGAGIGLILDPIEFHIQATYRASLGSLYRPNYYSEYYYRFAYPSDILITAGIHIQLTKRTGKTKAALKKEAKALIYNDQENPGANR
ncbi:MAG: PorT family protein [Bacteroidales bacterium]|nr:PorT family protein [Bacteroidales bacterium]